MQFLRQRDNLLPQQTICYLREGIFALIIIR